MAFANSYIQLAIREQPCLKIGDTAQPSAANIVSQSVKTTFVRGERGYNGGKKVNGRKRPILVDMLGLLLSVKI